VKAALDWSIHPLRTLLFAPGNQPRKLAKVGTFGADAVILDLEDAVPIGQKEEARPLVRAALPTYRDVVVMARPNALATGRCAADLDAVVCPSLQAILLPKVESPAELAEVDALLEKLEVREGMPGGTIRVLPLIETARGVSRVEEIAGQAPPRVLTLAFGPADLTADLGIDLTRDGTEVLYARSRVVIAARAAGLAPPIDGPFLLDLHDHEGLIADARRGRQLGYAGKIVIYPAHVAPVNRVFSEVAPAELERARRIVRAFESAVASGSAALQVDGVFVDYPIYRRAQRILRLQDLP
jgi:citrate lyase subunit beta/citryl-CoA lyase